MRPTHSISLNRPTETGIYSIRDLESHYRKIKKDGHWFDKDTMRFFGSKISETLIYGERLIYFLSSECGPSGIRRYSVRAYDPETGDIDTVGLGFQGYKTLAAAKRAAQIIATKPEGEPSETI